MTDRVVAIIQARMNSTRLPGKAMLPLAGLPVLAHVIARTRRIEGINAICVAIPESGGQQTIVDFVDGEADVVLSIGPEKDVLRRYLIAAEHTGAEIILRITSDCPLLDPGIAGIVLEAARSTGGYARTSFNTGVPLGLDVEAATVDYLAKADKEAIDSYQREHVLPFIWQQPNRFSVILIDRLPNRRSWRLTLDEPSDYELMKLLFDVHGACDPTFDLKCIEQLFSTYPELLLTNSDVEATPIQGVMENSS